MWLRLWLRQLCRCQRDRLRDANAGRILHFQRDSSARSRDHRFTRCSYQITITAPLQIVTTDLTATVGQQFSATFVAQGGTPPYSWSLTGGSLPSGISTTSSGSLSGVPLSPGSFTFSAGVKDNQGSTATQSIRFVVNPASLVVSTALPEATAGQQYSAQLSATGGIPPYTWSAASGSLVPKGLVLSVDGKLSGTPTDAGIFTFAVTVSDGAGLNATSPLFLTVLDDQNPSITRAGLGNASSGQVTDLVPGEWITIYGKRLSSNEETAQSTPFPTILGGAQMLVNGRPVPLWYASSTQVNAFVPSERAIGTTAVVEVLVIAPEGKGLTGNILNVPVAAVSPGLAANGDDTLVLTSRGIVTSTNPVLDGDEITLYGTGFGLTIPLVPTNQPAPSSPPAVAVLPVNIDFGVQPALVRFVGLSPGSYGLFQINAKVSLTPRPAGDPVRLVGTLTVGDKTVQIGVWY